VVADSRGNQVTLEGSRDGCERARRVLEGSTSRSSAATTVAGRRRGRDRLAIAQGSLFDFDPATSRAAFEEINLRKRRCARARRAGRLYPRAQAPRAGVRRRPAGTGKTWLAVAHAVALFERKEVDRIILSRPAVEAGERLGFLPGDMREKVDPYLRPIYDALYDLMDARIVERAMQTARSRSRRSPSCAAARCRTPS
jgi:phosphate starvation-inducible PhoH-like protein